MCHCLLDPSVVNHSIDEWRPHLSASVDTEGLKGDILNITYDCYSQITMAKWQNCKLISGNDFLFCFAVNVIEQRIIAFLAEKCCFYKFTK